MMPKMTGPDFLTDAELKADYPLMVKFFGIECLEVRRIDGPGMTRAQYIFASDIEGKLKEMAAERFSEEFSLVVSLKRKPKKKKG